MNFNPTRPVCVPCREVSGLVLFPAPGTYLSPSAMATMSKLSLIGDALRSSASILNPMRRLPLRRLSTETEGNQPATKAEGNQQPEQNQPLPLEVEEKKQEDASFDPFLQASEEGVVFGRLTGIGKNTMKTDVIHFLEGCKLSTDDVKVEYNKAYTPVGMMLQFPSRSSYDMAVRQTIRKGRLYRIEKIDRSQWEITSSYHGKTVLLQGLPRSAFQEDVERFLSGCNFDPSTIQIILRNGPEAIKLALVQFHSRIDAMNAFCFKNRSFCLNNSVTMRVLH